MSTTSDACASPAITCPGIPPAMAPAVGVPLKAPMADPCPSYCAGGNPIYGFHPISNTAFGFGDHRTTVQHAQMYVNMHADDTEVEKGSQCSSSDASHVVSDWDRQMMKKYRAEGWTDGERESEFEGAAQHNKANRGNNNDSSDSEDSGSDEDSDDDDTLATEETNRNLDVQGRDEESPLSGRNNSDVNEFENPGHENTSPFNGFSSAWAQETFSSMFPGSRGPSDSGLASTKDQNLNSKASKGSSWRDWFPMWMRCGKRNQ